MFYRIQYSVDNGATFQPFVGLTWPLNRRSAPWQIWPVSDGAGWYPVIPAADNWSPPNLLLEWSTSAAGKYILRLQLGDAIKNVIATAPDVALQIDNTAPTVMFDQLSWKFASEPDSAFSLPGRSLLGICPTIHRKHAGGCRGADEGVGISTAPPSRHDRRERLRRCRAVAHSGSKQSPSTGTRDHLTTASSSTGAMRSIR